MSGYLAVLLALAAEVRRDVTRGRYIASSWRAADGAQEIRHHGTDGAGPVTVLSVP
jgi:hypothetical protein